MRLDIAWVSDRGGRQVNQDAAGHLQAGPVHCLVVADGLGGHSGGEQASQTAVSAVLESFAKGPGADEGTMRGLLLSAQKRLSQMIGLGESPDGMKTTLAVVLADDRTVICGHVGDTRIYVFNDRALFYQSRDHSLVGEWVEQGRLTQSEIRGHPKRNLLLSALGKDPAPQTTVCGWERLLEAGDGIMLCSDGFWELVLEEEVQHGLESSASAQDWLAGMELLVRNRQSVRSDNFTCLAAMVLS